MPFFNLFPKVRYDIQKNRLTNYDVVTNIFFRTRMVREVLGNVAAYYEHILDDTDTPETLAEKIYGDAQAHWIILYANDIVDPQYDWPLTSRNFNKYLVNKYKTAAATALSLSPATISSIQVLNWTKTAAHHYEKVISRTESLTGIVTESRFIINEEMLSNQSPNVPFDTYDNMPNNYNLANDQTVDVINWSDLNFTESTTENPGRTVVQITRRNIVYIYDHEVELNDAKRTIKIIKPEYYPRIMAEFNELTNYANAPFRRRFINNG